MPPHEAPTPGRRRRARLAVGVAVVLLFLVVSGGRAWWRDEAESYRGILHVPLELRTTVGQAAGRAVVDIAIADRNWLDQAVPPLVPDHGKLMHAFLVRLPDGDAFAHVHPQATGNLAFRLAPPPLPAGRYVFYGDIVHESGTTETLTTEIELPPPTPCSSDAADACPAPDPDDSWTATPPVDGSAFAFDDGLRIRWDRPAGPITAGRELEFRFEARNAAGDPVALEPYMGMAAHAAVRRDDGSVFVHLHPTGSISMAAQAALAARAGIAAPDSAPSEHTAHDSADATGDVDLLYAFPRSGTYTVWLQIKAAGEVRTAAWTVEVQP